MLRHQDQPAAADRHILDTVAKVEKTGPRTHTQSSAYAQMLCTTSYTAARAGQRDRALKMIKEAARAARNLPDLALEGRLFPLTPAAVGLYAVGVHWALGDPGAALEAGRNLREAQFKTAERKGRMHTDLGRAWWQWGKAEQTTAALLSAARVSPGEGPRPARNPTDRQRTPLTPPTGPRSTRTRRSRRPDYLIPVCAGVRSLGGRMKVKYKETARGGLAVNVIEC
ncbi:hypothetical protein GCM10010329_61500 [Streptomyces spiroverticillatus]|uniref:Tetratricopeptide repeat protein n=1 Tax=Streptomyces finlayi TaxID=67296 RepID=A0A918X6A7_9ACTN|nr:hypothetical protein [Streptomyces finlayi]GHA30025.1 hypothetical protein GCM10010329_61500 [Streptomyces spiroverticillatus]GHD15143.1 hypothetical protein GCM10010334_74950 [Streptomyces finlayi]